MLSGTPLAPLLREGLKFVISHLCFITLSFFGIPGGEFSFFSSCLLPTDMRALFNTAVDW